MTDENREEAPIELTDEEREEYMLKMSAHLKGIEVMRKAVRELIPTFNKVCAERHDSKKNAVSSSIATSAAVSLATRVAQFAAVDAFFASKDDATAILFLECVMIALIGNPAENLDEFEAELRDQISFQDIMGEPISPFCKQLAERMLRAAEAAEAMEE